jgi:hypothetical protein|tara:strand:- start:1514 stop:1687 length:174 start_codon:yes stop_codon:yes gene_type:complete
VKLNSKILQSINLRLEKVQKLISLNNGTDLEKVKDELYEVVQQIEEETHRCYNEKDD